MSEDLPYNVQFMEEFEILVEKLRNRGDVKLGSYLERVAREEYSMSHVGGFTAKQLLDAVENYEREKGSEQGEETCVACGEGTSSAQELEKIIEEKRENAKDF